MGSVEEPPREVFREYRGQCPFPGGVDGGQETTGLVKKGRCQSMYVCINTGFD